MEIKGIEGLTLEQIDNEVMMGGKFVIYQYCISALVITFKRGSKVYFVKSEENAFTGGILYTMITILLGWWGFPWGPIYTIQSVIKNCTGGKDVTTEITSSLHRLMQKIEP